MHIVVTQQINKAYYQEYWEQWLSYRSIYRKWQKTISFTLIVTALLYYFFLPQHLYVVVIVGCLGVSLVYDYYYTKHKWMRDRLSSRSNNSHFTITFSETGISINSQFTTANSSWPVFTDAIVSEKGLFLIPENRVSIYLQAAAFEQPEAIKLIAERVKKEQR